ncbi:serine/threonine-protein kinase [Actinomadura sp. SCN-SB]|uniref:serine/threonine-protein kinase n=1 Tax=Actinomadura sp. SCN-SB TaxID=3373092 RepID=UPI0037520A8C
MTEPGSTVPDTDGRRIAGRYRLLSQVGRGGMGIVWRARDEMLDREVAVKEVLPRPELSDREREDRHKRTLREARASARLNHPGVVTVHDVVDEDDRPWIVMELVRARSLQEVVDADGPLPPARAAEIGRQVVAALRAAHAIGILHRDVKPANVLITGEGRAVLTDFGIAQVAGDATLTKTGLLVGSPAYMSPERVRGDGAIPASDLWALGATLYAACEGRPPHHRGDTMAVLAAIMTQDPDPPRNAGELTPVLYGLLERDPVRRLTAEQAEEMLGAIASGNEGRTLGMPASMPLPLPDPPGPPGLIGAPVTPSSAGGKKGVLLPILAGALTALVIVGAAAVLFWPDGKQGTGGDGARGTQTQPAQAQTQTGVSAQPADSAPTPASTPTGGAPTDDTPSLPAGLRHVTGPGGFTIGVPEGWTRREQGASTFWTDPATGAYIQVDRTPWDGDPYHHWQEWERQVIAKNVLPGYRRIDLVSTGVAAGGTVYRAADIEFTWNGKHGIDRGVRAGGRTYAVFVAVPESRWNDYRPTMNNVIDSFRP